MKPPPVRAVYPIEGKFSVDAILVLERLVGGGQGTFIVSKDNLPVAMVKAIERSARKAMKGYTQRSTALRDARRAAKKP